MHACNPIETHLPPDFRLVAKIGLSVAAAACIGLLLLLSMVVEDGGAGYGRMISAYDLARQSLGQATLAFGLAMIIFAGIATWLFALYASFRVAGPLFRIARDLEQAIERGPVRLVPIRKTDKLQRVWAQFDVSVAMLRAHYAELGLLLGEVRAQMQPGDLDVAQLEQAITRLKAVERNVRL